MEPEGKTRRQTEESRMEREREREREEAEEWKMVGG